MRAVFIFALLLLLPPAPRARAMDTCSWLMVSGAGSGLLLSAAFGIRSLRVGRRVERAWQKVSPERIDRIVAEASAGTVSSTEAVVGRKIFMIVDGILLAEDLEHNVRFDWGHRGALAEKIGIYRSIERWHDHFIVAHRDRSGGDFVVIDVSGASFPSVSASGNFVQVMAHPQGIVVLNTRGEVSLYWLNDMPIRPDIPEFAVSVEFPSMGEPRERTLLSGRFRWPRAVELTRIQQGTQPNIQVTFADGSKKIIF